ncbi:MAG: hypothetical protein KY475_09440, partial [Planctomycetes bacterium]|nr:hypothetical protein [Planctomycetota bacterium]
LVSVVQRLLLQLIAPLHLPLFASHEAPQAPHATRMGAGELACVWSKSPFPTEASSAGNGTLTTHEVAS